MPWDHKQYFLHPLAFLYLFQDCSLLMMKFGNPGYLLLMMSCLTILTRNDVSAQEHEIIVVMIAAMQVGWKLEEIQYQHPTKKLLGCFPLPLYLITLFQTPSPSTVRIQMPLLPQVSFWLMKLYLQTKRRRRKQNKKRNFLNGRLIQKISGVMNHHHQ